MPLIAPPLFLVTTSRVLHFTVRTLVSRAGMFAHDIGFGLGAAPIFIARLHSCSKENVRYRRTLSIPRNYMAPADARSSLFGNARWRWRFASPQVARI